MMPMKKMGFTCAAPRHCNAAINAGMSARSGGEPHRQRRLLRLSQRQQQRRRCVRGGCWGRGAHLVEAAIKDRGRLVAACEKVRSPERGGQPRLDKLGYWPAGRSEHGETAVLELGLAVVLEDGLTGGAVERIEALVANLGWLE